MKIVIVKRTSHLLYFDSLIKAPDVVIFSGIPEFEELLTHLNKQDVVSPRQLSTFINQYGQEKCQVLIPLDNSNCFDTWYSNPDLRALSAFGISASVIDTQWVYNLEFDKTRNKLSSLTHLLEGIYTPDVDTELNISDTALCPTGVFVDVDTVEVESQQGVLIVPDFGDYDDYDTVKWLMDVKQSIEREGLTHKVLEFSSDNASMEQFAELKSIIGSFQYIVTPRSYLYYLARAWGANAIVYDKDRYVSISFCRELNPSAAFIRHKRDFANIFSKEAPETLNESLRIGVNVKGTLNTLPDTKNILASNGHIVLWGRMPPHNYSGGRYHGWLLAEGFAALGFSVTVMTDNRPYFIDDFAHLPGHRNIHIQTTSNFLDESTHPSYTAEKVLVIPGMDRKGEMYKGAIEYASACGAKLGLVNFESPNWFNSMVFPNRDPELWKYWKVISKFSSLILSTTEISNQYAKEYYLSTPAGCEFQSLYAPINSAHAENYRELERKEKRVVVFFPRSGYSAHKGWQNIVDTIGDGFKGHTVVFLCGESDLPEAITQQLHRLSNEIGFGIEYKVKINDQEKFRELARACLLIFPSQFEGYGYPPLEALSVGTPTVAFELPVLRETCGEYLIYAPKGDWESFKHLANSALMSNYRLSSEAVQRAISVSSFSNFLSSLNAVVEGWTENAAADIDSRHEKIEKAFFDSNKLIAKFKSQKSKNIEAKAVVKSVLYGIDVDPSLDVKLDNSTRVIVALNSASLLDVDIGSNTLVDLVTHLNAKNIGVDFVSQDFAIETIGEKFEFSHNRFFSIGSSERAAPMVRGEVGLFLLKLLNQYNYLEVISVDGFLNAEIRLLSNAESCPSIKSLAIHGSHNQLELSGKSICYVGENFQVNTNDLMVVPNSILISRDRKDWLVNGPSQLLTIVTDTIDSSATRLIASLELVLQNLQKQGVNLQIRLAATAQGSSIPYFVTSVTYAKNDELYKLMRQSMFVINLLDSNLSEYLGVLARLVGVIEIDSDYTLASIEKVVYDLSVNPDDWKMERSKRFNQEVNKLASTEYYSGLLSSNGSINRNLLQRYGEEKSRVISEFEKNQPRLFKQFKDKLNKGNVSHAAEILKRYSSASDVFCQGLLIELMLLAGQTKSAEPIYNELKLKYPGESFGLYLGSKIKYQLKEEAFASQYDYYALMLDSRSLESVSASFRSSISKDRTIDAAIHQAIVKNAARLNEIGFNGHFTSERQAFLYNALMQEHSNNGNR